MTHCIKGMAGTAKMGKDTVGNLLAKKLGYKTYAFAEPVKLYVHALLGWKHPREYENCKNEPQLINITMRSLVEARKVANRYGIIEYTRNCGKTFRISKILEILGIEPMRAGEAISPRKAWQLFGTEWGRNHICKDIWVDLMPTEGYVITDVRFDNEAKAVRAAGGHIIQVWRPTDTEQQGILGHESEANAIEYLEDDIFFENTGNMASLSTRVDLMIESHFKGA